MATLTIFTPTYNRAYLLSESYATLKNQTCKDFEWLIVDDGSVDNTEELVQQWVDEKEIDITYIKTENRGKPSATNTSIEKCTSDLWVCVDSDDHLAEDAVEKILSDYEIIKEDRNCNGIISNMYDYDGNVLGGREFPSRYTYIKYQDIRYKEKINADLMRIYKTSVLKKYRYPIISGEKFIGESYVYEQIGTMYYIDRNKLYYAKYREDGLTANYLRLHVDSPKGYKLLKEQVMIKPKPLWHQFRGAIMYVAACMLCEEKNIVCNSPRKIMTLCAYPFGVLAYYKKYYGLVKKKKAELTHE